MGGRGPIKAAMSSDLWIGWWHSPAAGAVLAPIHLHISWSSNREDCNAHSNNGILKPAQNLLEGPVHPQISRRHDLCSDWYNIPFCSALGYGSQS